jgi:predicted acyl esterase
VTQAQFQIRDGMRMAFDVAIEMDDGVVMRADVYLPLQEGRYPIVLTYGPYAKGLSFQEGNPGAWSHLTKNNPEVLEGSSNLYQSWELVDPEKWVPDGYALVRVDSRGTGRSPGFVDPWSPRETQDLYECIEWCGTQPWSNGKVGLNGISYYAMNAWQVASLKPKHLSAICAWEGASDYYREATYHGGIMSGFLSNWFPRAVHRAQYGCGERGSRSQVTGELVCGPETLPEEVLAQNRIDIERWMLEHSLDGPAHRDRSPSLELIDVPVLSAANWGGQGLHTRGNFEAFLAVASKDKWLEAHGGAHWESFYTNYGVALQKKFFGYFLKGEDTGMRSHPKVTLQVRHIDHYVERAEKEWPLARTQWTRYYFEPQSGALTPTQPQFSGSIGYETQGDGLMFLSAPLDSPMEITGPSAVKMKISSSTTDTDVFVILRVFRPDGKEVTFHGSNDPRTPIGMGWLRASHRKLDPQKTLPYRPYHTHDELQALTPNVPVDLDVEVWPTCIVIPKGFRFGVSIRGRDYESMGEPLSVPGFKYTLTGVGPFIHDHPVNRPKEVFQNTTHIHFKEGEQPFILLPIIAQT